MVNRSFRLSDSVVDEFRNLMFLHGFYRYDSFFVFLNSLLRDNLSGVSGRELYKRFSFVRSICGDKRKRFAESFLVFVIPLLKSDSVSIDDSYFFQKIFDECMELLR